MPFSLTLKVAIELRFSAFSRYSKGSAGSSAVAQTYSGLQCAGVMWPLLEAPSRWPISPPLLAGKVNMTDRKAMFSPGEAHAYSRHAEFCKLPGLWQPRNTGSTSG